MQTIKPLKRDKALHPLSHGHHHSLLFCWKIRTGLKNKVEVSRIKRYSDWFFEQHVLPHFQQEEQYLFPILGNDHLLVKRALAEHRRLTRLFTGNEKIKRNLSLLEEELECHIRFEERILFQEIQEAAEKNQSSFPDTLVAEHSFKENTEDLFWE